MDEVQIYETYIFAHLNDQICISYNSKYYKTHSYSFMHISSEFQNNTKNQYGRTKIIFFLGFTHSPFLILHNITNFSTQVEDYLRPSLKT